ncbi:hypothetical protein D3C76_1271450 [compost metagenome]
MGADHARHRAVRVAGDHIAAILDPDIGTVVGAAAVFGLIDVGSVFQVIVEQRHDPWIVIRVDHAFPGQHGVVQ